MALDHRPEDGQAIAGAETHMNYYPNDPESPLTDFDLAFIADDFEYMRFWLRRWHSANPKPHWHKEVRAERMMREHRVT